jgi:hypothetical protein
MTGIRLALFAMVACLTAAQPASAQTASLQKYLRATSKSFDFEESHPDLTPINWTKVKSPGYPAYTRGQFANDVHHSPRTSFRIDLDGGNCAYEYAPRRIIVEPAFDYCLEGWIKTEGLRHSKAYLAVWFNDQQGRPVPGSRRLTRMVGGTRDWQRVQVYVSPLAGADGKPLDGRPRFADLSMEVVGTEAQDIGARVWFDDIRLHRIPRLRMSLAKKRLLYIQGEDVVLHLSADGLLAKSFPGRLTIRDDRGTVVSQSTMPLVPGENDATRRDILLPKLPPGAYHVTYDIPADTPTVLCRRVSLAILAPAVMPEYLRGQGMGLADIRGVADPDRLVELLGHLGTRYVKMPLWQRDTSAEVVRHGDARAEQMLNRLRHKGVRFVGVFAEPPDCVRGDLKVTIRGVTDLFATKADVWQKPVAFTISRYAGAMSAWQIGHDEDPSVTRLQTEPGLLENASKLIDRLTAGVPLGVPWPAMYAWPEQLPSRVDFVALRIGPEVLPEQIQEYLAMPWPGNRRPRIFLTLDPIARSRHDPDERVFDFVMRVLAAKQAGVEEIFFAKLVDAEHGLMHSPTQPGELFVVARTLCDMLGGARFAGTMPLEHKATALVFERDDGSETIVLWREHGKFPVKEPLYLGDRLMQVDLRGNRTTVPHHGGVSSVPLGPMPVFITGIDPQISRTRRSVRLGNSTIASAYRRHKSTIKFTNGFERGISGYLRLQVPKGWNVDPLIIRFSLAQGETFRQELTLTVPYNEVVGDKEFLVEFNVDAKSNYRFVAVARVHFEMPTAVSKAMVYQDGPMLIIEQEITNIAKTPVSYHAYVQIPGRPMLNHYVPRLPPGETVTKRYLLPYTPSLENKTALVGVRDDTPIRGFANMLLPLGGVHARSIVRSSSAAPRPRSN